eukprot:m.83214 g.83214  ORF g.83214 m.83214 type:complete len:484 (+) comp8294_c0_seq3:39-1490(+)
MALKVTAQLQGDAVVFSGESIRCTIRWRNDGDAPSAIAWSLAQMRCQCTAHRTSIALPPQQRPPDLPHAFAFSPARGERGVCAFESQPSILLCDVVLEPGEERTAEFEALVPSDAPPSYRGELVNYSWRIVIGTQRVSGSATAAVEHLRVPFRILPLTESIIATRRRMSLASLSGAHSGRRRVSSGSNDGKDKASEAAHSASSSHQVSPVKFRPDDSLTHYGSIDEESDLYELDGIDEFLSSGGAFASSHFGDFIHPASSLLQPGAGGAEKILGNPFLIPEHIPTSQRPQTVQALTFLSQRRKPNVFKISFGEDKCVVQIQLSKTTYRIGEDVLGWFDWTESNVPCYQIAVMLESTEEVSEAYQSSPRKEAVPHPTIVHARSTLFCRNMVVANALRLPIPLTSTPEFDTSMVSVRWQLSFHFAVGSQDEVADVVYGATPNDETVTQAPASVQAEVIKWSLPLTIIPTNPVSVPFRNVSQTLLV